MGGVYGTSGPWRKANTTGMELCGLDRALLWACWLVQGICGKSGNGKCPGARSSKITIPKAKDSNLWVGVGMVQDLKDSE